MNLGKQNRNLQKTVAAHVSINRGSAIDCQTCLQQLPEAQKQALAGYQAAVNSDKRYRKANTERWVDRGIIGALLYIGFRLLTR